MRRWVGGEKQRQTSVQTTRCKYNADKYGEYGDVDNKQSLDIKINESEICGLYKY